MIRDTQLAKMSLKELVSLQARVSKAIAAKQEREKIALKEKIAKMAEDSGFEIGELFGGKQTRKRAPVAIKYRHPRDKSLTWTGRGRMPRWLAKEVKAGKKKEKFLIK